MSMRGYVTEVSIEPLGGNLISDHILGATTLALYDASDFNETGGTLEVEGTTYTYTAVDFDTDIISGLSPALAAAQEADTKVIIPDTEDKWALIENDEPNADADRVRVPHFLQGFLVDGIREQWESEPVIYDEDPETGILTIQDIIGVAGLYSGNVDPSVVPPPLDIPVTVSPAPTVVGGIRMLHIVFPPTDGTNTLVEVHMSTAQGFTATKGNAATLVKTVQGTQTTIEEDAAGQPLVPGTTYYVRTIAFNDVTTGGATPSAEASGSLHQITDPDISVEAAWVGTMTVDHLIGGTLQAETYIAGEGGYIARGAAGEEVSLRGSGFQVKGATSLGNPIYVDFPTDGGKPNIISGVLEATTLKVLGNPGTQEAMSLAGISELATGSLLRLNRAPQASVSAPVISEEYATQALTGSSTSAGFNKGSYYEASTNRLWVIQNNTIRAFDGTTGAFITSQTLSGAWMWLASVTKDSAGNWYAIGAEINGGSSWLRIRKYNSSFVEQTAANLILTSNSLGHQICSDGTNVYVVGFDSNTTPVGLMKVRAINTTTLAVSATNQVIIVGGTNARWDDQTAGAQNWPVLADAEAGSFDLGGARIAVLYDSGGKADEFTTLPKVKFISTATWTIQDNEEFLANGNPTGLAWDATRFRTVTDASYTSTLYSTDAWTTASSKWWFQYSKRDNTGPYETTLSPTVSITRTKRKGYRVTATHNDTPQARVYVGRGASQPLTSAMFMVQELGSGVTTFFKNDTTLFSGTTPTTIAFPNSTPAQITSADGSTYWKADGTAKYSQLIVDSTTDANILSKDSVGYVPPALRVGNIAGQHLRIDGNEILAIASDVGGVVTQTPLLLNKDGDSSAGNGLGRFKVGDGGRYFKLLDFGTAAVNTDASGIATYTHSLALGLDDYFVWLQPASMANARTFTIVDRNSNSFTFRVHNGTALVTSASVTAYYMIFDI